MKKLFIFALIISIGTLTSCCSNSQKSKKTGQTAEHTPIAAERPVLPVNHSYLTEENIGETITIKGRLSQNGNSFTLLENPDSKSRVTFIISVENDSLKKKLSAETGNIVQISGILTSVASPWQKGLKALSLDK